MYKAKELREQRAGVMHQQAELVKKVKEEKRTLSAEETQLFDKLDEEQKKLLNEAESCERIERFDASLTETRTSLKENKLYLPGPTISRQDRNNALRAFLTQGTSDYRQEYGEAAQKVGLGLGNTIAIKRALSSVTAGQGQELVPTDLYQSIYVAQKAVGGLRNLAYVFPTESANPLNVPTVDDTAHVGSIVAQSAADAEHDIPFGTIRFSGYVFSSGIQRIPMELIRDAAFDVTEFVGKRCGESLARGESPKLLAGAGTTEPSGLLTSATVGVTTASPTAFTYAELVGLLYSVNKAYRNSPDAAWLVSDDCAKNMRLMTDTIGRPLWEPSLQAGQPDRFLGKPVVIDYSMAAVAAGNKVASFGSFKDAFWIRTVGDVQVSIANERYWEFRQIGVVALETVDSGVVNPNAVKVLQLHA